MNNKDVDMQDIVTLVNGLEAKIDKRFDGLNDHIGKLESKLDTMQADRTKDIERLTRVEMEHIAIKEDVEEFKGNEKAQGIKQSEHITQLYEKYNYLNGKVIKISSTIAILGAVLTVAIKLFWG